MRLTIYTTEPLKPLKALGDEACKYLNQTPGRNLTIEWKRVEPPAKVPTQKDKEGKVRIDWLWFRTKFRTPDSNFVAFHFTPKLRKQYKLTDTIHGSAYRYENTGFFYLVAKTNEKAKHYPFAEIVRLILHETAHIDTKLTGVPWLLTHIWEGQHRIHELPAHLSYLPQTPLEKLSLITKITYATIT